MLSKLRKSVFDGIFVSFCQFQPSLESFQKKFTETLGMLLENEQHGAEQKDICERVRVYIQENFRDSHLSVAMLGDEMKISP